MYQRLYPCLRHCCCACTCIKIFIRSKIDQSPKETNFREFLNNKKTIEINKGLYIDEILKYKNPLEFFKNKFEIFNLGTGVGNTVLEVIHSFEKLTGIKLNYQIGERRMGDVIEIYANNDKAKERLNWKINYNIDDIMQTAWEWELKRNK